MFRNLFSTTQSGNNTKLSYQDITWALGLYGTAVGAGTLFLPINAGIGGFFPLLVMSIIAFPLTYFSHLGLTRLVLSGSSKKIDFTEVVKEHFGKKTGGFITVLYFFAIYPILLVYSVAITNTVSSFMIHQLQVSPPPRIILSGILVFILMLLARYEKDFIVKIMSVLVFPFIIALIVLTIFLIPHWNSAILSQSIASNNHFWQTIWLAIPVMIFSFNHSPIISSFAVSQRNKYGEEAEAKCNKILKISNSLMVITVMFFVFSCVFSLSPADLAIAKQQNISILSYLANHFDNPIFNYAAPLIAFIAISKSFLGHYLGAEEGLNSIVIKTLASSNKTINPKRLDNITTLIIGITAWIVATLNPSILSMIEALGGPIIAVLLFLLPMYAIYKVPSLHKYAKQPSNIFVIFIGCIALSAMFYNLIF
ncbi:HAAAP family serine/threonine permease [Gammaproteobacteria bacterium]|nr:HAAAP family serine/threonine permease [Gammaproteobacteria bacterium]